MLRRWTQLKHVACQSPNPPKSANPVDSSSQTVQLSCTHCFKMHRSIPQQPNTSTCAIRRQNTRKHTWHKNCSFNSAFILNFFLSHSASPLGDSHSYPNTGFIPPQRCGGPLSTERAFLCAEAGPLQISRNTTHDHWPSRFQPPACPPPPPVNP